jgi:hypothetical protein
LPIKRTPITKNNFEVTRPPTTETVMIGAGLTVGRDGSRRGVTFIDTRPS